ncbi:MAG: phage holin family protein [Sporichthyaceae bacterium]
MTHATETRPDQTTQTDRPDPADLSTGELFAELSRTTSDLVRDEIRLATAELKDKGKHASVGIGMFGAAGVVALFGGGALVATAIAGLATAMDTWLAALVVTVALFAVAGVLALAGKKQVSEATPPKPEQAMAGVKADVETVKEHLHR